MRKEIPLNTMNAHYTNWYHLCFYYYSRLGTEIFHCKGKLRNTTKPLTINLALSCHVTTQYFSLGFPSWQLVPKEAFLPVFKTLLLQVWASSIITDSPCIELLLSLSTGLIRKQGPLVEVRLNHPCMSCCLSFARFYFPKESSHRELNALFVLPTGCCSSEPNTRAGH